MSTNTFYQPEDDRQRIKVSGHIWRLPDRVLHVGRKPLVMGILNVTPDSFSDGGRYTTTEEAVGRGLELIRQGADLLDIGGESSRPKAKPVPLEEELRRVLPVVQALARQTTVPLSIDTSKAEVARACLLAGAHIINDITALQGDAAMVEVARTFHAGLILMHMQGTPETMQIRPHYENVISDVFQFLESRLQAIASWGIAGEYVAVDPGIGFGKTANHNLELLAHLSTFQRLCRPLCLGVSRKGFIGQLLHRTTQQRLIGSLAVLCQAMSRRAVQIVRVHDVEETRDLVDVFDSIEERSIAERVEEEQSVRDANRV